MYIYDLGMRIMAYVRVQNLFCSRNCHRVRTNTAMYVRDVFYHGSVWNVSAFPGIIKLTHLLKNIDLIDGRLINVSNNTVVVDDFLQGSMHRFKYLARAFIGSATAEQTLRNHECIPRHCFGNPSEREPMTVNSLTKVCNFLDISAQQRKSVRLAICPQVTQHQIWAGALMDILTELKNDIKILKTPTKGMRMGLQIVSSCLKLLDSSVAYDPSSASWMRLKPMKGHLSSQWDDVLEMFSDLINCLRDDKDLLFHYAKLDIMREGLFQIKDVLIDKNIGYKETQHQESLVQKKLTKTLGHSSKCLFTLLMYYLCGYIRDIEIDVSGGIYEHGGKDKWCLCMGKILTSNEEKMVRSAVKQMDRALGLFKFVRETAGVKGDLELQGHLWCVGAEESSLVYKGNSFLIHGIGF